jgi:hypothetical protein
MWIVIYVAQSDEEKDKIEGALTSQGILTKARKIGKNKSGNGLYEILVPKTETDDACMILTSVIY